MQPGETTVTVVGFKTRHAVAKVSRPGISVKALQQKAISTA